MPELNNILVTGANSGLGKHCCEVFNGIGYTRATSLSEIMSQAEKKPFQAIIHSAFNTKFSVPNDQLYAYLNDTTLLTKKLLNIPHQKFVFISTADVYPKNGTSHLEDERFSIDEIKELYPLSKLISESIVKSEAKNYLILRPTAMLGKYAKPNSLMKILANDKTPLTLAPQSTFNYVKHSDVSSFIAEALNQDLTGVYNIAASTNITLQEAANHFGCKSTFGHYHYQTNSVNNAKAVSVLKNFNNTSLENIKLFLEET